MAAMRHSAIDMMMAVYLDPRQLDVVRAGPSELPFASQFATRAEHEDQRVG
jgi:hypothetical protein